MKVLERSVSLIGLENNITCSDRNQVVGLEPIVGKLLSRFRKRMRYLFRTIIKGIIYRHVLFQIPRTFN